jgi:hypothetical protein
MPDAGLTSQRRLESTAQDAAPAHPAPDIASEASSPCQDLSAISGQRLRKEQQKKLMREVMQGSVAWAEPFKVFDAVVLGMEENGHKWRHPVQEPIGGWPK